MSQTTHRTGLEADRSTPATDGDPVGNAIATALEHRAVIEQAKGVLCVIYDIDEEAAFAVLRWRSQTTNTKLRVLAAQLIDDFRSIRSEPNPPSRSRYDDLLLTAHERVRASTPAVHH